MVGQTISHYRLYEKIGSGGIGVVYKAEETHLDRSVALKFLTNDLMGDQETRKRFEREAKASAALSHSNVCIPGPCETAGSGARAHPLRSRLCLKACRWSSLGKADWGPRDPGMRPRRRRRVPNDALGVGPHQLLSWAPKMLATVPVPSYAPWPRSLFQAARMTCWGDATVSQKSAG